MTAQRFAGAAYGLVEPDADADAVRAVFGGFPSGVVALAADIDGVRTGMVASSFSVGVSFSPPVVMFSAQQSSATWRRLRDAPRIGVTVLAADHGELCLQMASRTRDRFAGVETKDPGTGALFIEGSPLWLETRLLSETPLGDHSMVLLEVTRLGEALDIAPLVYHSRRFHPIDAAV